jgi:hypothetical protein
MRSRIVAIAATAAIAVTGAVGALAQEATPQASAGDQLTRLGLLELTVTATADRLSVDQPEVPAGRYLVTLADDTGNPDLAIGFVRLDEGETIEDLSFADELAAGTPMPMEEPSPDTFQFLYDNYIAGGPSASSPQVVVDLPAGDYGVWTDDPFAENPAAPLTVTGDPNASVSGPEPAADVTIVEEGEAGVGYAFRLDGELRAGPQVVKVLNASDQPHFVLAMQYPEPITIDQLMAAFMFDPSSGATPPPGMLDDTKLTFPGYASTQSASTTQWVTMDLVEGQAILVCFIPDPATGGVPHAFEGMIQLADVAGS